MLRLIRYATIWYDVMILYYMICYVVIWYDMIWFTMYIHWLCTDIFYVCLTCTTISNTVRTCDWRFCTMSCFITFQNMINVYICLLTHRLSLCLYRLWCIDWLLCITVTLSSPFSAVWLCLCYFRVCHPYRSMVLGDTTSLHKMTWCPTTYLSTTDIQYCYLVIDMCSFTNDLIYIVVSLDVKLTERL